MFIQLATIIICLLSTVRGGNLIRRGDFKNYGSFIGTNKGDKYAITPPQIIDVSY